MQVWRLRRRDVSSLDRPYEGLVVGMYLESSELKDWMGSEDRGW